MLNIICYAHLIFFMKKLFFLLAAASFLCIKSSAQFEKGNYIVGGEFEANFTSPTSGDVHNHHIAFDPRVGYYFMNGLAAGIDLTGEFNKTGNEKSNDFGGGPFVRYHLTKYLYAEGSYQYLEHNVQTDDVAKSVITEASFNENKYAGGLGYIIKVSKHLAIEPRLFYDVYTAHGSEISAGPVFSIGFHNYFWKYER